MIVIVNYGMGNLRSVQKAFERINIPALISSDSDVIYRASRLILPGVGHFAHAMQKLHAFGLIEVLETKVINERTPILGICLGMQLMTDFSEEGNVEGLGWINGKTNSFSFESSRLKIPHMGWNNLTIRSDDSLYQGINQDSFFYFVHSYYVTCDNQNDTLAETNYGNKFVSSFNRDNIYGCQFHPEKSHDAGLQMLKNFASL